MDKCGDSNQHIYDTYTARENSPSRVKKDLLKNGCASSKISSLRLIEFQKNLEIKGVWQSVSLDFIAQENDLRTRTEMFH